VDVNIKIKFAFVTIDIGHLTESDLQAALLRVPCELGVQDKRLITVQLAKDPGLDKKVVEQKRKEALEPTSKLFIVGYSHKVREEDIYKQMDRAGQVESVFMPEGKNYAFVEFSSVRGATAAIKAFDNTECLGGRLTLQYRDSKSTESGAGARARRPISRSRSRDRDRDRDQDPPLESGGDSGRGFSKPRSE
jgi:RNA recognition motif-containing protein